MNGMSKAHANADPLGAPGAEGEPPQGRRARKAEAAREALCTAAIACLDEVGYAETTISRIVDRSGLSRGALTHHFPAKEDLIIAATDRLLSRTSRVRLPSRCVEGPDRGTVLPAGNGAVEADFLWLWDRLANTAEGRALLEILGAARTDGALRARLAERLSYWHDRMNAHLARNYTRDTPAETGAQGELWTICRVFFRGLITQDMFEADPAAQRRLVARFARIMAPHLTGRAEGGTLGD